DRETPQDRVTNLIGVELARGRKRCRCRVILAHTPPRGLDMRPPEVDCPTKGCMVLEPSAVGVLGSLSGRLQGVARTTGCRMTRSSLTSDAVPLAGVRHTPRITAETARGAWPNARSAHCLGLEPVAGGTLFGRDGADPCSLAANVKYSTLAFLRSSKL